MIKKLFLSLMLLSVFSGCAGLQTQRISLEALDERIAALENIQEQSDMDAAANVGTAAKARIFSSVYGGVNSNYLDYIPVAQLTDGDPSFVITEAGQFLVYLYDSSDTTVENYPGYIRPDDNVTGCPGSCAAGGWVLVGFQQGGYKINSDTNGMSQAEMAAVGMYGSIFFATGAGTWLIPDALEGMSFCVYSTTAAAVILNPDDSDDITLDGTLMANGDALTSESGAGDFICLVSQSDTHWFTFGRSGVWTDTN